MHIEGVSAIPFYLFSWPQLPSHKFLVWLCNIIFIHICCTFHEKFLLTSLTKRFKREYFFSWFMVTNAVLFLLITSLLIRRKMLMSGHKRGYRVQQLDELLMCFSLSLLKRVYHLKFKTGIDTARCQYPSSLIFFLTESIFIQGYNIGLRLYLRGSQWQVTLFWPMT